MQEHALHSFEAIIAPWTLDRFIAEIYERETLHLAGDAHRFHDLLRLDDIAALVQALQPSNVRAIRRTDDGVIPRVVAGPDDAVGAYRDGYTLVLTSLAESWPAATAVARAIHDAFSCAVQANAYISPPGEHAFPLHHDTHDIVALQCSGSKRWEMYPPSRPLDSTRLGLPRIVEDQLYRKGASLDDSGDPCRVFDARSGDVWYLPRGTPHQAFTGADGSIHIAFGLHPIRFVDVIHALVGDLAERHVELRRSVPLEMLRGDGKTSSATEILANLARLSSESTSDTRRVLDWMAEANSLPNPESAPSNPRDITLDTVVCVPSGVSVSWYIDTSTIVIRAGSRWAHLPLGAESALRWLGRRKPFRPRDLDDDLDDETRVRLVQVFMEHGLLAQQ